MTAAELLALISVALLLQLAAGIGWTIWRPRHTSGPPATLAAVSPKPDAAWPGWREFRVARREFEDAAQSQCSFYLQAVDGQALPPFKPGQFLTFTLDVEPRRRDEASPAPAIARCYSLSDRPDPAHYRVTIKRVLAPVEHPGFDPGLSSNHFHDHVQVGDILRVKAPAGHFTIDADSSEPVVLIGGGIGITPIMSMLRWCITQQPQRAVYLYYGVHSSRTHAFRQELEEMASSHTALRLHIAYSRPGESDVQGRDYQHRGRVDIQLLQRTLSQGRHQFYVCGPPSMMQALVPALAELGVPVDHIHCEAFGPASVTLASAPELTASAAAAFEVRFKRSGRTLTWDGRDASLLDFAELHGIVVESGCRSGSCGSCETRLLEGDVQYAHVPDHDIAAGHCLLCVGRPSTPLVLEA